MAPDKVGDVDLLILGAGWTSRFLIPSLESESISYAATSTTGRKGTIQFVYDYELANESHFEPLPTAQTVLITFPLKGEGRSKKLVRLYKATHTDKPSINFIQLGSTGIWTQDGFTDVKTPHDTSNPRAIAEDELLGLGGIVLNLAGLWSEDRHPLNWIGRIAQSKEQLAGKRSLHLIHGEDVARSIIAVHQNFRLHAPSRWLLTNRDVYDWWDIVNVWADIARRRWKGEGDPPAYQQWVEELLKEAGIKDLPRESSQLGRVLDSSEFWQKFGLAPSRYLGIGDGEPESREAPHGRRVTPRAKV